MDTKLLFLVQPTMKDPLTEKTRAVERYQCVCECVCVCDKLTVCME